MAHLTYTYRVYVTNRCEAAEVIWRDYNQCATIKPRIDELKSAPGAADFPLARPPRRAHISAPRMFNHAKAVALRAVRLVKGGTRCAWVTTAS